MNKNILKGKNTQSKVYNYICEYYIKHSYMPSYEEIMTGTGIKSKCTVKTHIDRLFDAGWIESENRGQARAYRIVKKEENKQ